MTQVTVRGTVGEVLEELRHHIPEHRLLTDPAQLTTYECGVDAVGTDWSQMNIRYYVFAFLFVIFDVESVFVFPWAVILGSIDASSPVSQTFVLAEMFVFIAILAVGLVYAWRKKVLVWE